MFRTTNQKCRGEETNRNKIVLAPQMTIRSHGENEPLTVTCEMEWAMQLRDIASGSSGNVPTWLAGESQMGPVLERQCHVLRPKGPKASVGDFQKGITRAQAIKIATIYRSVYYSLYRPW